MTLGLLLAACRAEPSGPICPEAAPVGVPAPASTVTFVRHAEKAADGSEDPPLTEAGVARARCLAEVLEPADPTALLSTDTQRTRDTLGPLAERSGVRLEVVDTDVQGWATRLRQAPEGSRIVVSAHSNTIPAIVSALGGDPGPLDGKGNIPHEEYDRMLTVVLGGRGQVVTVRTRYCVRR